MDGFPFVFVFFGVFSDRPRDGNDGGTGKTVKDIFSLSVLCVII